MYDSRAFAIAAIYRRGMVGFQLSEVSTESYRDLTWDKLEYFKGGPALSSKPSAISYMLDDLAAASEKAKNGSTPAIPLRYLSLDLDATMGWDIGESGCSVPFNQLFRRLASTRLERLVFTSVASLPEVTATGQVSSIKALQISGSCSFRNQAQFEALKRLLSLLPSLSQLHLSNGVFFGRGASADAISKLDTIDQCFRYPELYALLFFLRGTKVKIFAYRGVNEKREMRWMRSDVTEDFERDCWTL